MHNNNITAEVLYNWAGSRSPHGDVTCVRLYKIAHTVVGDPWTEWLTTTKQVTRGFHAWKYIPIYSQHNIYKFSFLPRTIIGWNIRSPLPHSVDSRSINTFWARITKKLIIITMSRACCFFPYLYLNF